MAEIKESAEAEAKPSFGKRIFRRIWSFATVITVILALLGGINETIQKFKERDEHTSKTFLDGFRDYVGGLSNQVAALAPASVRDTFFGRLEKCHYGWTFTCDQIVPTVHYVKVLTYVDDATIACFDSTPDKLVECEQAYKAAHPANQPKMEPVYEYGPEGPTRKLSYPQIWILPPIPTFETLRGLPDATRQTAKMVYRTGWLATIIFGGSGLFVIASLIAIIGSMKSKDWTFVTFIMVCWLVVGVPYLISGAAWCVQYLMREMLGFAYGLLSLLVLGVTFGSAASLILEVKHLTPGFTHKV